MSSPQVHIQDFVHSILPLHFTYSTSTHLTNLLNHDFLQKLYFNKCILQKLYDTPFFNKQSVFGSVYDFSNLSLHYIRLTLCLLIMPYISLTMPKIIECNGLITTSQGPTRTHNSKYPETAIQWCSLKYNPALKLHPNVKVNVNYRLLLWKHNGTFQYYQI